MIALAVDAILVLVPVEAAALVALHRLTGAGIPSRRLLGTLAAGFFLMLATRLALHAGASGSLAAQALVAASLLAALVAHIVDLTLRWRG